MCINSHFSILIWIIAILLTALGNVWTGAIVKSLRRKHKIFKSCYEEEQKENQFDDYNRSTELLGALEIFIYFCSTIFGEYQFIGWWLAIKSVGRWNPGGPPQEVDQVKDSEEYEIRQCKKKKAAAALNIFLIGNLMNVIFGVTGGLIAKNSGTIHKSLSHLGCLLFNCG